MNSTEPVDQDRQGLRTMSRTASEPEPTLITKGEAKPRVKSEANPTPEKPQETLRDFLEQIVVAILLAMLIRGFDAEAFVIPTGSMAPTLMGRHKEVICPECGLTYAINSSEEIDRFIANKQRDAVTDIDEAKKAPERLAAAELSIRNAERSGNPAQVREAVEYLEEMKRQVENAPRKLQQATIVLEDCHEAGLCVNCRARIVVDDMPSFKGDRILVMKFPYELSFLPGSGGPERWDVVVFHRPEGPEINYIKRLIGLPGETLRIHHGDIHARTTGSKEPFTIRRKPLFHQQAMQILVYDDHYRPKALKGKAEWNRWNPSGGFQESSEGKFSVNPGADSKPSELRYRHLLPDPEQWTAIQARTSLPRPPRPTLITDFYAYNTAISASEGSWYEKSSAWLQHNWVGDLTLSCQVELEGSQPGALAIFELIEAGISNRCEVDLNNGVASLYHGDKKLGETGTALQGIGHHDVEFANVDDRLTLWVDGKPVFQDGLPYDETEETSHTPTQKDLDPAGIALKATKASVSDLVLKRDIYYTQTAKHADYRIPGSEESGEPRSPGEYSGVNMMFDFLADPARFAILGTLKSTDYEIRPNHFMMLGDNSPHSSDSREWHSEDIDWRTDERASWEVPRSLLIGKAFFVYWPHGKPFGPDVRINRDIRIPFRPYFERMKWIR